ncbi:hypothetical protein [Brevundimonas diminuta]|uniref:hypothetical protein n=1 Tax=Brevundimonas diminuta TaxID=293 RepID=UPI003D00D49B
MDLKAWRESKRLSQEDLAIQLGLRSKGRISRLESRADRWPTDLAIAVDRLSRGAVPVAELRPDLHDVRVIQPEARA